MSGVEEKAILAGGCFWGMQDLIRKRPGVLSTRVGYTGGDVPNATYRNHGRTPRRSRSPSTRPDLVPRPARVLLPDPRPDDARPPGQRHRRELPVGDLLRRRAGRSPRTPSPTSTRPGSGRQGRHRGKAGRAFWEAEPSTRTTSSTTPTATRATSRGPTGCCPDEATPSPAEPARPGPAAPPGARAGVSRTACVRRVSTRCARQVESFDHTRELCSRSGGPGPSAAEDATAGRLGRAGASSSTRAASEATPCASSSRILAAGLGVRSGRIAENAVRALRLDALQERLHLRAAGMFSGPVEVLVAATRARSPRSIRTRCGVSVEHLRGLGIAGVDARRADADAARCQDDRRAARMPAPRADDHDLAAALLGAGEGRARRRASRRSCRRARGRARCARTPAGRGSRSSPRAAATKVSTRSVNEPGKCM